MYSTYITHRPPASPAIPLTCLPHFPDADRELPLPGPTRPRRREEERRERPRPPRTRGGEEGASSPSQDERRRGGSVLALPGREEERRERPRPPRTRGGEEGASSPSQDEWRRGGSVLALPGRVEERRERPRPPRTSGGEEGASSPSQDEWRRGGSRVRRRPNHPLLHLAGNYFKVLVLNTVLLHRASNIPFSSRGRIPAEANQITSIPLHPVFFLPLIFGFLFSPPLRRNPRSPALFLSPPSLNWIEDSGTTARVLRGVATTAVAAWIPSRTSELASLSLGVSAAAAAAAC
uniref:Predicted protein n=1 Tax=Hordeum vulgare subsp. vulgare TaxID=112509 RepID=F2D8E9_HORVV|nr:predicted protein [Hordeum vulgare subsp. vulgare]